MDEVYIQFEELRNSRSINDKNNGLPITGSSANLVDGPKGKRVVEVEDIVVDEQVSLKGLMQGCKEGEAKNMKVKEVDFREEGGKGKSVDGNIGRTTTYVASSHISISYGSDSFDENKIGDDSSDEDLSNRPRFVVWKKEIKDGKVVQRNVLFEATSIEKSNSALTPPQTTTHEMSDINSYVLNQSIPQHYSNHLTNSYMNNNDSDMGSNISSNGSSDSDMDIDDDYLVDDHLQACMWYGERMSKSRKALPKFHLYCHGGKFKLPLIGDPSIILQKLLFDYASTPAKNYQANTSTYIVMFSFTSPGMKFDTKFTKGVVPRH
ncbi:hypothetical protein KIW84_063707 [Lathyrus oleraceus]|uniref:Uncharacterized protein n=1 Tax=Pisum sativum TaxID=3888 RepID=A0A9D4WAR7_PEA|nr:hypothetical protein KIW84_063707 [Pisum sativum]